MYAFVAFVFAILLICTQETRGENLPREITVDIAIVPPMVAKIDGHYSGFDVELFEAVARELNVSVIYREVPFAHIFDGVNKEKADAAIAGITITEEREKFMDFSHHYFDAGLHILVRRTHNSPIQFVWQVLVENQMYKWFLYALGFVFIFANIVWFFERKREANIASRYIPGVFDACWFVQVTMATEGYGDIVPKSWRGKFTACILMWFGIGFFSLITAHITTTMTTEHLKHDIQGPQDLANKTVATLNSTTSVDYLYRQGSRVRTTEDIYDSFALLIKGDVDAVVYDAPVLLYYTLHQKSAVTMITGKKFEDQYYGIALPQGSALRESINRALLKLRQNGFYDNLYKKWFGGSADQ